MEEATFHGMVLFGEQTAYLSHLPMFMSPHDYQAIFEVTLSKTGIDPMAEYLEDRRKHPGSKMYSLPPAEDFVLTDLVTPANPHDPQSPRLRSSFIGHIWRDHFESSPPMRHFVPRGAPVQGLDNVVVHVAPPVLFRKFNLHAPALPQLEYFLFGKAQELFLAHAITRPPDFDQILGVQVIGGPQFTDDELRRGLLVTFPERANSEAQKINEHEQVMGQIQIPAQRPDGPRSLAVQVTAGTEFYFETGDLESMDM